MEDAALEPFLLLFGKNADVASEAGILLRKALALVFSFA
jgi:hypothetical protein